MKRNKEIEMYELDYSQGGEKYFRLTVNYTYLKQLPTRRRRWANVTCSCGNIFEVVYCDLKNGTTKSCGCWKKERMAEVNIKHGCARKGKVTKEFKVWASMWNRITDKNNPHYVDYGGRGITICEEWKDFINFYKDMGSANVGMTLDRIDNNGNYCKYNCRWVNMKTQSRNKRNNVYYEYQGNKYILADLASIIGLSRKGLYLRLKKGISLEIAMSYPSRNRKGD